MATHKFSGVDDFLSFLPEDERRITNLLRSIVKEALPEAQEKLSYNVPFYRIHANICFIWPGAVLWGKQRSYDGVRMGFTRGHLLSNDGEYLDKGDRKEVYWKDFLSTSEIDADLLRSFLYEAAEIDEGLARQKKRKR